MPAKTDIRTDSVHPSEIRLGDVIHYYGVYFRIVSATCYPGLPGEETSMPCYSFRTELVSYCDACAAMPRHWAETWTFQGNDRATWTRIRPA